MSLIVREGKLDLVIGAGPGLEIFPSRGVQELARLCSRAGHQVGVYGGDDAWVRGFVSLSSGEQGMQGYQALIEDAQGRIHRLFTRALVRVSGLNEFPDPFPGWDLPGLIPLRTARKMLTHLALAQKFSMGGTVVVLGTGNRALRFASSLLEEGWCREVFCVELRTEQKTVQGWTVERTRFESLGGRVVFGKPIALSEKSPQVWQLKLSDEQGTQLILCSVVVSAGPFSGENLVCEYPAGSGLYELTQVAPGHPQEDVEGWFLEREAGVLLAGKILKRLGKPDSREGLKIEQEVRRSRARLRRSSTHREQPVLLSHQGKWLDQASRRTLLSSSGTPKTENKKKSIASIECLEEIHCQLCADHCPENALHLGRVPRIKLNQGQILQEDRCTGCGICVEICPSRSISLIHEPEGRSTAFLTLPKVKIHGDPTPGQFMQLFNRVGASLGTGRVMEWGQTQASGLRQVSEIQERKEKPGLLHLEIPAHLVHEVKQARPMKKDAAIDEEFLSTWERAELESAKVDVQLNGDRRRVRPGIPLTVALSEVGATRTEDVLFCQDGSCGLCYLTVDGIKKRACQTLVHQGMAISYKPSSVQTEFGFAGTSQAKICPCLGISEQAVSEQLLAGKMRSPERILEATRVGKGRCHGQRCLGPMRRLIARVEEKNALALQTEPEQVLTQCQWIDWQTPWQDWILAKASLNRSTPLAEETSQSSS